MQQRRSWVGSLVVVLMPILFCALLFVLQKVINNAINTPDNRVRAGTAVCWCSPLYLSKQSPYGYQCTPPPQLTA
jgi:hypothetical protein